MSTFSKAGELCLEKIIVLKPDDWRSPDLSSIDPQHLHKMLKNNFLSWSRLISSDFDYYEEPSKRKVTTGGRTLRTIELNKRRQSKGRYMW